MKAFSKNIFFIVVLFSLLATATPAQGGGALLRMAIGVREPTSIGGVHELHTATVGSQYWNQDHSEVYGVGSAGDKFGDVLAWGDFDGNGFIDLAIGNPEDSEVSGVEHHGSVNVLYGGAGGLSATGSQYFDQDILGTPEIDDYFGLSLAVGNFNSDAYDDLVIGVPGEGLGGKYNAGGLYVLYGSITGLTQSGIQWFDQNTDGVYGDLEQADLFGFSLAVGDFNNDAYDDLAVGSPYENIGDEGDAGHVNFLYGSSAGLEGRNTYYRQDMIAGSACEQGDRFGFALAAGDFDNDGHDDLAVGVPYEFLGSTPNTGVVDILYGTDSGFDDRDAVFNQSMLGISGCVSENMDLFGYSLAAGDLNGDGFSDLVIGSPGESTPVSQSSGNYAHGSLNVIYGSPSGLTTAGALWLYQGSSGVGGMREASDQFAYTLVVGDLNGDGYDDVVVGVPYEDVGDTRDAGIVNYLYGSQTGLVGYDEWYGQETFGGQIEAYDMFGISLAIWSLTLPYSVFLPLIQR